MVNNITLVGRVGRDVEVVQTSGNPIAKFTIATDDKRREATDWHNIVTFGTVAGIAAKFFQKGSVVSVTGQLHYDNYTDKQGNKRTSAYVVGERVMLISGGKPREDSVANDDPLKDEFPL